MGSERRPLKIADFTARSDPATIGRRGWPASDDDSSTSPSRNARSRRDRQVVDTDGERPNDDGSRQRRQGVGECADILTVTRM
jgi:hypothetical protein